MESFEKLREELAKLDATVGAISIADRGRGAEAIRDLFVQHRQALIAQDEKVLSAFAEGWVSLSELAEQFEGRI